jgi:hypothetical protein
MKPKKILISPTEKASQRTKNRIRENGPVFEVVDSRSEVQKAFNSGGWLLRSEGGHWFGWLQRNEFHVELIDSAVDKFMIDKP